MPAAVSYEAEAGIARVTLTSEHNRNALSHQLRAELGDALARATSCPSTRVVLLAHAGRAFCSGADLTAAGSQDPPGTPSLPDLLIALRSCPKPVVAALDGPARAGGMGLVAACDFAVVARDVTFAFSEVRIGVVPAVISAVVLPLLPPRWASDLLLTGRAFTAEEALAAGLVTRLTHPGMATQGALEIARDLLLAEPEAVAETKRLLRSHPSPVQLREELEALATLSRRFFASDQAREGISAFRERRLPSWAAGNGAPPSG